MSDKMPPTSGTEGVQVPLRVLIICTHFPPLNRTGARRPYYLARQLRDEGHKVSVLTSAETKDASWDADLSEINVMRCPYSFVQHDMRAWQRLIAKAHHHFQGSFIHGPLRVLADLTLPLNHATRWDVDLNEITRQLGLAEVVVATGPAWSSAQFGMCLATKWNATFLMDYRDPWNTSDPKVHMDVVNWHGIGLAGLLRRRRFQKIEQRIARAAYALTAVSPPLLQNAQMITRTSRGVAISGGFDPDIAPASKTRNAVFTLVYTGRLYTEQDWNLVLDGLEALSVTQPDLVAKLRLKLIGAVSTDVELLDQLRKFEKHIGIIEFVPRMGRVETLLEQQQADALLHLAYRGKSGYLPVKFLEYLNANRPIVLISQEHDLMEDILTRTRTGVVVPDAGTFERLLVTRIGDWRSGEDWSATPDGSALSEFSYPERMKQWVRQIETWHNEHISGRQ